MQKKTTKKTGSPNIHYKNSGVSITQKLNLTHASTKSRNGGIHQVETGTSFFLATMYQFIILQHAVPQ